METLPVEVLIEIFSHLDNASMWTAIKVCSRWSSIFANSQRLVNKFELKIDSALIYSNDLQNLPIVPIKNVSIEDINLTDEEDPVLKILNKYQDSIDNISLSLVTLESVRNLRRILLNLTNLRHIRFDKTSLAYRDNCPPLTLSNLKSMAIVNHGKYEENINKVLQLTRNNTSVEKIELVGKVSCNNVSLNDLAKTMPKFKNFVMLASGSEYFFENGRFSHKLERLETRLLGGAWYATQPRLQFLKSQVGSLKELKLHNLPRDYDGGAVLKFIIEEMNLESFYYGDTSLILNGRKQPVGETWCSEVTTNAGLEMLRQFPTIKKLRILLCDTGTDISPIVSRLNQNRGIFTQLQELKLVDVSGGSRNLLKYMEIYKNFTSIKKLIVESNERALEDIFRDFLPFMTQLEEIWLNCDGYALNLRLAAIRDSCLGLKTLKVKAEQVEAARAVFQRSNVAIASL